MIAAAAETGAELVTLPEAASFLAPNQQSLRDLAENENNILRYGIEEIKKNNSINLVGDPKNKASVISFTLKGIHPHDIATILDDDGVAIRAGHHCCQILHEKIGMSATARASIGLYNTKEDIDILLNSIEKCKKVFKL